MIKKLTAAVLCLLFLFSLCAYATSDTDNEVIPPEDSGTQVPQEFPEGQMSRRPGRRGEMGGMRTPPEGFDPSQMPTPPQGEFPGGAPPTIPENTENMPTSPEQSSESNTSQQTGEMQTMPEGMGGRPDGSFNRDGGFAQSEVPEAAESAPFSLKKFISTYQTPVFSVVLLALAFLFVIFYKRKNY